VVSLVDEVVVLEALALAGPSYPTIESWSIADPGELRRLAQRLEHELATVLGAVPAEHRTVSGLSRWTGVVRPVCHRVIAAGRARGEPLEILHALPGVRGVEEVVQAIARRIDSREVKTSAAEAVRCYKQLVGLLGGSQAKAQRAVAGLLSRPDAESPTAVAARRASFEASAALTSARSDALVMIQCVLPRSGSNATDAVVDNAAFVGHTRLRMGPGHLPVLVKWDRSAGPSAEGVADGRRKGLNPAALLAEFSSDPFPRVVTKGHAGAETDVLDFDTFTDPRGADVFVASRADRRLEPWGLEFHAVPRIPTARLLVDLLIHKDLSIVGPAEGTAYYLGVSGMVSGDGAARWFDRLGALPRPADVTDEAGAHASALADSPRHAGLIRRILDDTGVTLAEVRWVRWDVAWPVWGADHVLRVMRSGDGAGADGGGDGAGDGGGEPEA
jgi:hypothetical protein